MAFQLLRKVRGGEARAQGGKTKSGAARRRRRRSCASPFASLTAGAPGFTPIIGPPNDRFERQADRIANSIMQPKGPDAAPSGELAELASDARVQRKCAACENEERLIQRAPDKGSARQSCGASAQVAGALGGSGSALPASTRQFFELRFGRDFSNVRVHTGARAERSARGLGALAYTSGRDIVFSRGTYDPSSQSGRHLIAHELTHVVQQEGTTPTPVIQRQVPPPPVTVTPQAISQMRFLAQQAEALLAEGSLTAAESAEIGTVIYEAEAAIATAGEVAAAGATATTVGEGALAASAALAADDLTGVGVADDVAIPFVLLAAAVSFGVGFAIGYNADEIAAAWERAAEAVDRAVKKLQEIVRRPRQSPEAQAGPQTEAGPRSRVETQTSTEERRNRRRCQEEHPYAQICEDTLSDRDEVAVDKLMREGFSFDQLGECSGFSTFGEGAIDACSGAPGESWHCKIRNSTEILSIFGCLCCAEDGSTGMNWRGAHISRNLSRR